jgi:hypothetical protein
VGVGEEGCSREEGEIDDDEICSDQQKLYFKKIVIIIVFISFVLYIYFFESAKVIF